MMNKTQIINNLKIAYLDNEVNSNISIVFVHGNSLNSQTFNKQFNNSKLNKYRLLALDMPGHGNSDQANNYSVPLFVNTIVDFCKALNLKNFILAGHSLGGHFSIQSIPELVSCIGTFIFGTPPVKLPLNLDDAFLPHPVMPLLFKKDLNYEDIDLLAKSLSYSQHQKIIKTCITTTHNNVREQLLLSIQNGDMVDEANIIENINIPIALLSGKEDAFVNTDYINSLPIPSLWQKKLILIEASSHSPHFENPEVFNTFLNDFVKTCSINS